MPSMVGPEHSISSSQGFRPARNERAYVPLARDDDGVRDRPLLGLAGSSVGNRFRSWTGRSGRRTIFSVYPARHLANGSLPTDGAAVVVAVVARPGGVREVLWAADTGAAPESFFRSDRVMALADRPDCELHLHLLAADADDRRAIVADFGSRPHVA